MNPIVYEPPYREYPPTEEQRQDNRAKSKVRCRIEHMFGFMEQTMGGTGVQGLWLGESNSQRGTDQPRVQYVPVHGGCALSIRVD